MAAWSMVLLALGLPWFTGLLWMRVLYPMPGPGHWPLRLGYGYLLGLFGVVFTLRGQSALGFRLTVWPALVLMALFALIALYVMWRRQGQCVSVRVDRPARPPSLWQRALIGGLIAWLLVRFVGLVLEVWYQPLFPWDAWTTWGVRARVWTELRMLVPFVSPEAWLADTTGTVYTIEAWDYPITVSLFAAWLPLAYGAWNETAANIPWLFCALALTLSVFGQARLWGASMLEALIVVWLLMSLPMLDTQVALAGYADLWMATVLGFGFMAFLQWVRTADWRHGLLAAVFVFSCPLIKHEGVVWALLFLPALAAARLRGYALLGVVGLFAVTAAVVWHSGGVGFQVPRVGNFWFGLDRVDLPLIGDFSFAYQGAWEPVLRHLLLYSNWHLLPYLVLPALVVAVFSAVRRGSEPWERAGLVWVVGVLAALYVLFFWTEAHRWALLGTSINRVALQFVVTLLFWMMALWMHVRTRRPQDQHMPGPSRP